MNQRAVCSQEGKEFVPGRVGRILVAVPQLDKRGGVANYFSALRGYFPDDVEYFFRGSRTGERFRSVRMLGDYWRFFLKIVRRRTELVHINTSLGSGGVARDAIFILIARLFRRKVVVFFRGWDREYEGRINRGKSRLPLKAFFLADAIIVLARDFRKSLRRWGYGKPIICETTVVDDSMADDGPVSTVDNQKEAAEFVILFLARVEKEKGIYDLVSAFSEMRKHGANVRLVIAGDGGELDGLKEFVSGRNIQGVTFSGFVEGTRKREMFSQADVYVLPTRHGEGMPNSVLEAMVCGLPVVTCPVGGIKDFFIDGEMGRLLEQGSADDIRRSLESLISERQKREEMGRRNRCFGAKHFLASAVASRFKVIYEMMIDGRGGEIMDALPDAERREEELSREKT